MPNHESERAPNGTSRGEHYFPYPATKLIIAQHLRIDHELGYWGWLIVATFYDQFDEPVWSTEVCLAQEIPQGFGLLYEDDEYSDSSGELSQGDSLPYIPAFTTLLFLLSMHTCIPCHAPIES
jgi:hypothetical protein